MFIFLSIFSGIPEMHFNPSAIYYCHSPKNMNLDKNGTKKSG